MNSFVKKLISSITTLSLCTAIIGFPITHADEPDTYGKTEMKAKVRAPTQDDVSLTSEEDSAEPGETEPTEPVKSLRKLYIDFMGRGANPEDEGSRVFEYLTQADENNEFWIGVAVDKVNDLSLFRDGVYSLELAFEYDPSFVKPYFDGNPTEWESNIKNGSFGDNNSSVLWDKTQYEVIAETNTDLDTGDRENKNLLPSRENWKMCIACVTFKEDAAFTEPRFKNIDEDTKQYLIRLPFRLIHAPGENDADQNPTVLSLVRGPEELNIGSADTGVSPYSQWETTITDPNDQSNMKTLFTFDGDIKLFGPESKGGITDIIAVSPESTPEPEATARPETEYTLSQDPKTLEGNGFDPETGEYYLSVPNEIDKLKLKMTSDSTDPPQVTANGADVTVNTEESLFVTDLFTLEEINKDTENGGEENGFNNRVVITDGDKEYIVHIRRLYKPKIVMDPGNSPYGLIEGMSEKYINKRYADLAPEDKPVPWDDNTIAQAKEAFDQSDNVNKQYGAGLVPFKGKGNLIYTTVAWNSYAHTKEDEEGNIINDEEGNPILFQENYDMDPTALFVYQSEEFKIPEIKAYDDLGNEITNVTTTFKIGEQGFEGVSRYTRTASDNVTMIDAPLVEGTTDTYTISGKVIRNDVYFIEYEYTYTDTNGTSQIITAQRPVIILSRLGDLYLSKIVSVNTNDVNYFKRNTGAVYLGNSLVAYRSMDLVTSSIPSINTSDVNYFLRNSGAVYLSTNQYYTSLN